LRRDVPAQYVGVTHEYLSVDATLSRFEALHFIDHACGASRAEKTERDLRLLSNALEYAPHDARSMFYLAQTYREAGRIAEAAHWYRRRVEAGGWAEEVWYAKYMLAQCELRLGNVAEFVRQSLEAYADRPSRAEPLYALAKHYRIAGDAEVCALFCEAGEAIPYPSDDSLFVEDHVYQSGFREEFSISGYYCRSDYRRRRGRDEALSLATDRTVWPSVRDVARRNSAFYARDVGEEFCGCDFKQIAIPTPAGWAAMNPSIAIADDEACAIVRTVNYRIVDGRYVFSGPDAVVRTANQFVSFDRNYDVVESRELVDCTGYVAPLSAPVVGFEDCRLFRWRGRWWASCTVRDRTSNWRCQIALLHWDDDGSVTRAEPDDAIEPEQHQKNWVPLVCGDDLFFVHRTDPGSLLRWDADRGSPSVAATSRPAIALDHQRGGSQAIRIDQSWLYVTHEVVVHEGGGRQYLHRFIELDHAFRVQAVSDPFFLRHRGIEFVAGLARDDRGRLVLSFGVHDCEAWLAFLDERAVLDRLKPM
ncbi:MAG: tetratricopeptide repeat protein, partial [Myxococcota bacterium]